MQSYVFYKTSDKSVMHLLYKSTDFQKTVIYINNRLNLKGELYERQFNAAQTKMCICHYFPKS